MLILLVLALALLILFPEQAAEGSKSGLILWATVLVPSLLPFSVLTSVLRQYIKNSTGKYVLLFAGILSGYPIGAKLSGELYRSGSISQKQALFFAGFTNNPSPMFVIFFVAGNLLCLSSNAYLFFLLMLASSLLGSATFVTLYFRDKGKKKEGTAPSQAPAMPVRKQSEIIDGEIINSALLLLKIGGYIMLFSIFTSLVQSLSPLPSAFRLLLCGLSEITTGNVMICQSLLAPAQKTALCLAATTFGGLSAAAQTNSVLQNTGLSSLHYLIIKAISSAYALILGFLFF